MTYWAGCNKYFNKGAHEMEPVGTATSMHECDGCERFVYCPLKQESAIFPYTSEIAEKMDNNWEEMLRLEKEGVYSK